MTDSAKYDAEMQKYAQELFNSQSGEKTPRLPIVCPTTFNKPCRLCDLSKAILFKKDNEGTPTRLKASELNRKKSYYSNTVFPTNPSEIVTFQYGDTVWRELMLFSMGPMSEVKDWLDPRTGRNVIITKTVVAGNKRRTTYTTKNRITASPLLDMSILRKLGTPECQLDNILELVKTGKVKPFYQSQLQEGPNELRFLPSWLGPGISKFFHMVLYHYGVTEEEFEMIQRGDLDPFAGLGMTVVKEATPATTLAPSAWIPIGTEPSWTKPEVKKVEPASVWDSIIGTEPVVVHPTPIQERALRDPDPIPAEEIVNNNPYPPCFGKKFDPNDQECMEDCAADGWTEACRMATEARQKTSLAKRQTAKRLVQ